MASPVPRPAAISDATVLTPCLQERPHALPRQFIGAFVFDVAGVAAHPVPIHLVALPCGVEPLPQLYVLDRLLRRRPPAIALPAFNPRADAVAQVFGVAVQVHARRLL